MIKVTAIVNDKEWDITGIIKQLTWSGSLGKCMRTVNLSYTVTDELPITYFPSGTIIKCEVDKTIFEGRLFKPSKNLQSGGGSLVAYDYSVFMSKSQISFKYRNASVNEIAGEVCKPYGLTLIKNADLQSKQTGNVFNKSGNSVLNEVMKVEREKSGKSCFVRAAGKNISIIEEGSIMAKYPLSASMNIEDIALSEDAGAIVNEIIITNSDGEVIDRISNDALIEKIGGKISKVLKHSSDRQKKAAAMLQPIKHTYDLKGLTEYADVSFMSGNKAVIESGSGDEYFIIESDSHTFKGNKHSMNLKLKLIEEVN